MSGQVALFLPSLEGGGAEGVVVGLAAGFSERGLQVDLVLPRAVGSYRNQVTPGVRIVDLRAPRVLASLPALVQYLRRERPQALLSTLDHANLVALWARRMARVPARLVIREANTLSRVSQRETQVKTRLMPRLMRRFYPWADAIVAVSEGVAGDLAQAIGLPRERIRVIYNPVVTAQLLARAQKHPGHAWLAPGQPPVVLGVGRLTAQKDFATLIRAFARVRQERPVRLLILGEGEARPELEALVQQLGVAADVDLPGFAENPFAYMARAAAFVLSSAWEGLPNVLIQAMACGCPAVSTDCPSGPAEILDGGRYGPLVPVGDVDALARAIHGTLASPLPAERLRQRTEMFSAERIVGQYLQILGLGPGPHRVRTP